MAGSEASGQKRKVNSSAPAVEEALLPSLKLERPPGEVTHFAQIYLLR